MQKFKLFLKTFGSLALKESKRIALSLFKELGYIHVYAIFVFIVYKFNPDLLRENYVKFFSVASFIVTLDISELILCGRLSKPYNFYELIKDFIKISIEFTSIKNDTPNEDTENNTK